MRYSDFAVVADACTKGHLQVWAWQDQGGDVGRTIQRGVPEGFRLLTIDEGREFKVRNCMAKKYLVLKKSHIFFFV